MLQGLLKPDTSENMIFRPSPLTAFPAAYNSVDIYFNLAKGFLKKSPRTYHVQAMIRGHQ